MPQLSAKADDELVDRVETWAEEHTDGNRSAAVRQLVDRGLRLDDVREELETELEHKDARIRELENQLTTERERQEEVGELVEFAETRKTIQQRKVEAGIVTRAKWAIFGMDTDENEE